jgi:hypothetical protein
MNLHRVHVVMLSESDLCEQQWSLSWCLEVRPFQGLTLNTMLGVANDKKEGFTFVKTFNKTLAQM